MNETGYDVLHATEAFVTSNVVNECVFGEEWWGVGAARPG